MAAGIGSCDCHTKTPDAAFHAEHCRYLKILSALDSLEIVEEGIAALAQGAVTPGCIERLVTDAMDTARREAIKECIETLQSSYPDHAWLNAACAALGSLALTSTARAILPGHDETMANLDALTIKSTDPRCTCAAIVNPNIPHARTCPLASPESK
jgi:hypothetical protein